MLLEKLYCYLGNMYMGVKQYNEGVISFSNSIDICVKSISPIPLSPKLKSSNDRIVYLYDANEVIKIAYQGRAVCYHGLGQYEKTNSDMKKACSLGNQDACNYLKEQGQ